MRALGDTPFVSVQQLVGEVSLQLGQLRGGSIRRLWTLALLFGETGPLAQLADLNGWTGEYRQVQASARTALEALNRIRYCGSEQAVQLGDYVGLRVLLRQRSGRVTYLPGATAPRAEVDFNGVFRVGVQVVGGPFVAVTVDPDRLELKKDVRFIRRDPVGIPACPTDEQLRDDA